MASFYQKYKNVIKWGLLVLVLAFVGQFVWNSNLEVIGGYLRKMPFTFLGVVGLSFFAYLSATIAWRLCMGNDGDKTGILQLFMIRHVGEMLSVFNPTSVIAGETLKAHYLAKNGMDNKRSISSILLSRILIILSALLLIILSSLYLIFGVLGDNQGLPIIIMALIVIGGFGYLLARFLLHSKLYLHKAVSKLQRRFGNKYITDKLLDAIKEINLEAHTFYSHNKGKLFWAFLLSVIHWIFGAAEFYLILKVLGFDISVVNAIAIEMGVILFKTVGAIVPGQVGVEEYANKVMLEAVGIAGNEVWLVVSIMRRARQLFWVGIAGVFYFFMEKGYIKVINMTNRWL
ncbi:MAG: hypothetical protein ACJA1A_002870 [Saprospiraceae bacterium]|jgi:uncharacterized protein (TIRG00374 family)